MSKYREFTVTPGIAGFKVRIGCSEAYFSDVWQLVNKITEYLNDPAGVEKQMLTDDQRFSVPPQDMQPNQVTGSWARTESRVQPSPTRTPMERTEQ